MVRVRSRLLPILVLLAGCRSEPEPPPCRRQRCTAGPSVGSGAMPRAIAADRTPTRAALAMQSRSGAICAGAARDSRCSRPEAGFGATCALPAGIASSQRHGTRDGEEFVYNARRRLSPDHRRRSDGWQDRVVGLPGHGCGRSIRSTRAVACLSCVFDYEDAALAYRHAYALDIDLMVPPERHLGDRGSPGLVGLGALSLRGERYPHRPVLRHSRSRPA